MPAAARGAAELFAGAGKKAGVEVWRIEALTPIPVDKKHHGKFYTGDSYIVLQTIERAGSLSWFIFFWLGAESSMDEQGAAALFTVELDDLLGGGPVQCREVQGMESDRFMQAFVAVQYLDGGIDSGFKHVVRGVYEKRLLHLKGARTVRVSSVPLSAASLNAGDVFILDLGMTVFMWTGAESNKREKAKGLDVGLNIKDGERGGKARLIPVAQGDEPPEFWEALGGSGPIAPAVTDAPAGGDGAVDAAGSGVTKLFRVSDATGTLLTTEVASGRLARSMLDTNDGASLAAGPPPCTTALHLLRRPAATAFPHCLSHCLSHCAQSSSWTMAPRSLSGWARARPRTSARAGWRPAHATARRAVGHRRRA